MSEKEMAGEISDRLVARFRRYVAVTSQSDAAVADVPSTAGQWDMARLLEGELRALGLADIALDEHAVLTARLPATVEGAPRLGFCAHMDTVDVGLSPEIHPQLLRYEGKDLCLNAERDIWLRAAEHPELARHVGEEIIFGDGTSVLGADNKAAVTTVMELLATLVREKPAHGEIFVAFVPDEEIGLRGSKLLKLERFPVDFAYTIDSCEVGEFVYETFNAAQVTLSIAGVTAHPMSAKGVLVNPVLVAADFIGRFDPSDTPECTEGREGYCWVNHIAAGPAEAVVKMSLRDFAAAGLARRKALVAAAVKATQEAFPRARLALKIEDAYGNIADALGNDRRCVDLLERAFAALGIAPDVIAMRGGTDGSALSARGVPTPNYFTGGLNFHSRFECLPVPSFVQAYRLSERLVALAAGRTA